MLTRAGSPTKPRSSSRPCRFRHRSSAFVSAGDHQIAVLAGQADRAAAGLLDRGDDGLVDGAGQHHLDDLHGSCVGDAQPVEELALDPQALSSIWPICGPPPWTTMGLSPTLSSTMSRAKAARSVRIDHGMAAVLDDDGLVVVTPQKGQGFGEGAGRVGNWMSVHGGSSRRVGQGRL